MKIDVTIDKNGEVTVQVRGNHGKKCFAATQEIEKLLGGNVTSRALVSEDSESRKAQKRRATLG